MKQLPAFLLGVFTTIFIIAGIGHCSHKILVDADELTEISRDTIYDTIQSRIPVPVDSTVIKYITVTLPSYDTVIDTAHVTIYDSVSVNLPITQNIYEDSAYRAWVSGYMPKLDSIYIFQPTQIITLAKPNPLKHWGFGIQAGCGITPNKIEPYIGIGVTYNIFSW